MAGEGGHVRCPVRTHVVQGFLPDAKHVVHKDVVSPALQLAELEKVTCTLKQELIEK